MRNPLRVTVVFTLFLSLGFAPAALAQSQYPPSIQPPVVGEPILAPTTPLNQGTRVIVPVAQSNSIPVIRNSDPVPVRQAVASLNRLTPRSLGSAPAQVTRNILIGGIPRAQLNDVPVASFRGDRDVEIQKAQDVPIIIEARRLPSNETARIRLISPSGAEIDLGSSRVNRDGELRLPPVTLLKGQLSMTIRVVIGGRTYSYIIRTTA